MIIIEGMDNSGKTKLAEYLAERFNLPHIKSPKDRTNLLDDALTTLILNPNAIFDRFSILSEVVYGPILRGKTAFDGDELRQWIFYMNKLVQCKPLIFYCRPPDEKILDFGREKHMTGVIKHGKELLSAYDSLMTDWVGRLLIRKYDFTTSYKAKSSAFRAVQTYLTIKRAEEERTTK